MDWGEGLLHQWERSIVVTWLDPRAVIGCSPGEGRAGRHRVGLPPRQGAQGVLPIADMWAMFDNVRNKEYLVQTQIRHFNKLSQKSFLTGGFKNLCFTRKKVPMKPDWVLYFYSTFHACLSMFGCFEPQINFCGYPDTWTVWCWWRRNPTCWCSRSKELFGNSIGT